MSLLTRRIMMMNMEAEDMAKEWALIGEIDFSISDFQIENNTFECDECTEIFIEEENLISNQSMGYSVWINDVSTTNNNSVRTTEGIRHGRILLMLAGDTWIGERSVYDYDSIFYDSALVIVGKLNTNTKATRVTIRQSSVEGYQIYSGRIRIWGR